MLIIGEKINATIPSTKKAIENEDFDYLKELIEKQVEAGSDYLDLNVGTGKNEVENMKRLVGLIEEMTDIPICIDTADTEVMIAGLETVSKDTPPIINSTTAESDRMTEIMPLVTKYGAKLIALAMGGGGVPKEVEPRLDNCRLILEKAEEFGINPGDIYFDPLIIPQSTDQTQCKVTLDTIAGIKENFPEAKVCAGVSNISFGLPFRKLVNSAYITMAISRGIDAAILNPLNEKMMTLIKTADMLMGNDKHCMNYIKAYKKKKLAF